MTPELPPLPALPPVTARADASVRKYIAALFDAFAARERILLARIAELEADNDNLRRHLAVAAKDILRLANRCEQLLASQDDDNA